MKLVVHVKPNSRKNRISIRDDGNLVVAVAAPPVDGKANAKVIEVLAAHFGKPKSRIRILRGELSRTKIVQIDD